MRLSAMTAGGLAILLGLTGATAGALAAAPMDGDTIRKEITGKRIYLQVPLGGEFPLYYAPDGVVSGSGESVGLGRFMAPSDSGTWWIAGNQLCQQWQDWYDGKQYCFELTRTGDTSLYWRRDDGLEGEARIGR